MAYSVPDDGIWCPQSEILCFVADKCKSSAFDDFMKIVSDFLDAKIVHIKQLVGEHCDVSHRLSKRTGN